MRAPGSVAEFDRARATHLAPRHSPRVTRRSRSRPASMQYACPQPEKWPCLKKLITAAP